ncbi:NAD(P)H-dependent oxidoreductase [Flagellimonas sp. 389]|uniref:NADPH-dependent FMN reductase n=1 Tax=Flagellimonas sp. 389 TaxID=2835862 RepID=UPI001BD54CEC|nr:NAD(P)H-dependent oxidoreductase [Flagellimonas sp. 389]MBS9463987.1 NAD(P)H-dependent oxidoreductase [Flagellimonas sp. 389]
MITVISGSNRKNNKTLHFAKHAYEKLCSATKEEVIFLDLAPLTGNVIYENMYKDSDQPKMIQEIQDTYFIPSSKFWFFVPEYNGSYPGIVKLLLDAMSVREIKPSFDNKKACITGIASGRAGNLRGMDHLADVLNHLGIHVHPNKNPISSIFKLLNSENNSMHEDADKTIQNQIVQLLKF